MSELQTRDILSMVRAYISAENGRRQGPTCQDSTTQGAARAVPQTRADELLQQWQQRREAKERLLDDLDGAVLSMFPRSVRADVDVVQEALADETYGLVGRILVATGELLVLPDTKTGEMCVYLDGCRPDGTQAYALARSLVDVLDQAIRELAPEFLPALAAVLRDGARKVEERLAKGGGRA